MRLWWVVILVLWTSLVGAQPYVIQRFDVVLTLSEKAELEVEERIQVIFNESRRGIFRDIPVNYENRNGMIRSLSIDRITVADERGNGQPTHISREGEDIRIRIGDPDVYLSPGTQRTYVIRYRCRGMMNWFEENEGWEPTAQLYWNVTGDRWDTRIDSASVRIKFPETESSKDLRARLFVGPYGSKQNQILQKIGGPFIDENLGTQISLKIAELTAARNKPLNPYEGMTIVLDLPYAAIQKPTALESALLTLSGMWGLLIPIIIFPIGLIAWWIYGRDPDRGVMVVQYDPPDGLSGPEAGTLLDEKVDQRDIAAVFFSLAIKGHLLIEPKEEGLIFKKRTATMHLTEEPDTRGLDLFESKMLGYLKKGGKKIDETDLRHDVAPHLMDLKKTLYEMLVDRGYYRHSPESARGWTFGCGCITVIALGVLFTFLNVFGNPVPSIIGGILGLIVVGIFSSVMPKRTPVGARTHDRVRGFEEFIRRAQGDEIEWMSEHHPDMAMFEKYLPHAIAFGLAQEWAKRFEGVLHEMPSWYMTSGHYHFNSMYFSNDIISISNSLGSAAGTPPRSSGGSGGGSGFSSGGGFSGGGFGGGGGGSW